MALRGIQWRFVEFNLRIPSGESALPVMLRTENIGFSFVRDVFPHSHRKVSKRTVICDSRR